MVGCQSLIFLAFFCVWSCHGFTDIIESYQKEVQTMYQHAFDSYVKNAFPDDELKPLSCTGRNRAESDRGEMDDVMGNFSLTLIDSLSTVATVGSQSEFERAIWMVVDTVSFNADYVVSVFEVTIRVLGGLLSAHTLASPPEYLALYSPADPNLVPKNSKSPYQIKNYTGELLKMAVDLGDRLLPAFLQSPTGVPYSRVNLRTGKPVTSKPGNCLAGAGSSLLEMTVLSRLSGNPIYEDVVMRATGELWGRRSELGLLPSMIDVSTGRWSSTSSGIGAGSDSFYEYLLKGSILFNDPTLWEMFNESYHAINTYNLYGGWFLDVHAPSARLSSEQVDALQMFWPGVQILYGDVAAAQRTFEQYERVWHQNGFTPESFSPFSGQNIRSGYPLRPEFVESAYFLYRATGDELYQWIGIDIVDNLQRLTRVDCGYAAVHSVIPQKFRLEDTMDSFFIAETIKYLYLLFSPSHPLHFLDVTFTTEGHPILMFPILQYSPSNSYSLQKSLLSNSPPLSFNAALNLDSSSCSDPWSDSLIESPLCELPLKFTRRNVDLEELLLTGGERKFLKDRQFFTEKQEESAIINNPSSLDLGNILTKMKGDGLELLRQVVDSMVPQDSTGEKAEFKTSDQFIQMMGEKMDHLRKKKIGRKQVISLLNQGRMAVLDGNVTIAEISFSVDYSSECDLFVCFVNTDPFAHLMTSYARIDTPKGPFYFPCADAVFGPPLTSLLESSRISEREKLKEREKEEKAKDEANCDPPSSEETTSKDPTTLETTKGEADETTKSKEKFLTKEYNVNVARPFVACGPFPSGAFDGGVVFVKRGICSFQEKVENAGCGGAEAVIVVNKEDEKHSFRMVGSSDFERDSQCLRPTCMVSFSSGETILSLLDQFECQLEDDGFVFDEVNDHQEKREEERREKCPVTVSFLVSPSSVSVPRQEHAQYVDFFIKIQSGLFDPEAVVDQALSLKDKLDFSNGPLFLEITLAPPANIPENIPEKKDVVEN